MLRDALIFAWLGLTLAGCGDDGSDAGDSDGTGTEPAATGSSATAAGTDGGSATTAMTDGASSDATTTPASTSSSATVGTSDATTATESATGSESGTTSDSGPGTEGLWQPFASLPVARQETSVVAVGGRMFVLGGFVGAQTVDTVDVYDPKEDAWTVGPPLPVPMHHINAGVVGESIYVTGFLDTLQFVADGRTFILEEGSQTWAEAAALPVGREVGASGVGVAGDRLYVYGGLQGSQPTAAAQYLDLSGGLGWVTIADLPTARDHMVGAAVGGQVFAIGGRGGGIGAHSTDVLRYDADADAWTSVAPMPTSRGGMAGAVLDGWIFVAGGEGNDGDASGVFEVFEAYDPGADVWHTLEPMLTPRHGMGAATIGGRIYVPGGATVEAFGPTEVCEVWIPGR